MNQGAILIRATGKMQGVFPANGSDFTLEELQGFVGGYIQVVSYTENTIMVVNEEGKGQLPMNIRATIIAKANGALHFNDYIAGDALLCPSEMVK
jgi:hypothetical protein